MKSKKFFLALIALFLGVVSMQAQIYPPGVTIRIFQPEAGVYTQLINNRTWEDIPTREIIINKGYPNQEHFWIASVPPFAEVKVNTFVYDTNLVLKQILLNKNPLPIDNPVFQGWRDGEVYDLIIVTENKTSTSSGKLVDDGKGIDVLYNNSSKNIEIRLPESYINQQVELFSALGRKVGAQIIRQTKTIMPAPVSSGMYIVRIGNYSEKIIINH